MARSEMERNGAQASANFLGSVQAKLLLLMRAKNMSRAALARSLDVDRSRVTHLLGANSNMTVDTLARIFEALGEVPDLDSPGIRSALADLDHLEAGTLFDEDHRFQSDEAAEDGEVMPSAVFMTRWETEYLEVRASEKVVLVIEDPGSPESMEHLGQGVGGDHDAEMFEMAA